MIRKSGYRRVQEKYPTTFTVDDPRVSPCPTTGCWLWLGYIDEGGYGRVHLRKHNNRPAHRVFFEHVNGEIPPRLVLDHTCRVRSCVNPDHLRVVTRRQNATQNSVGLAAQNVVKEHCPRCGGPYTTTPRVDRESGVVRVCRPCRNERAGAYARANVARFRASNKAKRLRYDARRKAGLVVPRPRTVMKRCDALTSPSETMQ